MDLQRTDDWFQDRLGKVTASRIADVMAKTKSGYSKSRENYMAEKIVEILTGEKSESYTNSAMQHGIDMEPKAKEEYKKRTFNNISECGFIVHPKIIQSGSSPDGLIDDDGLIEIKCPNTSTHLNTLLSEKIDRKYMLQMQFQMACTGRSWCDFVSFDDRVPENLQMFIKKVERDENFIKLIEEEVELFLTELNEKVEKLRSL